MRKRRKSLRGILVELLLAFTGVVWIATAAATWIDARYHVAELYDAQLEEYSEVLAAIVGHEAYEMGGAVTSLDHELETSCTYQVFNVSGELLLRSHAAPATPLATEDGFSDVVDASGRWRVFRRIDAEHRMVIVVAHDVNQREAHVRGLAVRLVAPLLIGLPLLAFAIWFAVRRALSPLARIAGEVAGRRIDRLDAVDTAGVPAEVQPLVEALNRLLARVEESFRNERRFTGDAAHELRTPLAALRAQAEVALTTTQEERRRRALQQVVAGVARATRVVEQMLALARLDASGTPTGQAIDVAGVVGDAVREVQAAARERGIEVAIRDAGRGEALLVRGDRVMMEALVRNLAENAVRHAPDRGQVRISLVRDFDWLRLDVEDSGPGVEAGLRERIFDRFYRAPGAGGGGSGLGLSISRRIVELHGGAIAASASEALGGLRMSVSLPLLAKNSLRFGAESGVVVNHP